MVESEKDATSKIFGDDMFEDQSGEKRSYSNLVKSGDGSSQYNLGSAITQGIEIASANVLGLQKDADLSNKQTNNIRESIWTHEIGHNLGSEHEDKTKVMNQVGITKIENSIGGKSSTTLNLPKLDSKAASIILSRANNRPVDSPGIFSPKR